jgi:hypothetical protein
MVFKTTLIIFSFIFSLANANIIYDKNGITVSELDINNYISIYKNSNKNEIKRNKALKEIILIKKTINFLKINNPEFLSSVDSDLKKQYNIQNSYETILEDFLRYQIIRNRFISQYFQNKFSLNNLEYIFSEIDELRFPISKNNCLTIVRLENLKNDSFFLKSFYENLKTNKKNFKTEINKDLYDVCINDDAFLKLEEIIIKFLDNETKNDFYDFVYGNIK